MIVWVALAVVSTALDAAIRLLETGTDTSRVAMENSGDGGKSGLKELKSHAGWLANRSA